MVYPKKSLGQNFLRSKKIIEDIARAGNAGPSDTILEIGPGRGILTAALLNTGARVIALEKDHRLIPELRQKFSTEITSQKLTLLEGDILKFVPSDYELLTTNYKLVASIPYYITGKIFRKFLEAELQPSLMVLLVQKEVAERIVARDKKESLLSISVKAYGEPRYIKTVRAGNFYPVPKVDSAIISIENISKKLFEGIDEELFFALLKKGFFAKRKKLAGNLKSFLGEKSNEIFAACEIAENARAENLTIENWKCLAGKLYQHNDQ